MGGACSSCSDSSVNYSSGKVNTERSERHKDSSADDESSQPPEPSAAEAGHVSSDAMQKIIAVEKDDSEEVIINGGREEDGRGGSSSSSSSSIEDSSSDEDESPEPMFLEPTDTAQDLMDRAPRRTHSRMESVPYGELFEQSETRHVSALDNLGDLASRLFHQSDSDDDDKSDMIRPLASDYEEEYELSESMPKPSIEDQRRKMIDELTIEQRDFLLIFEKYYASVFELEDEDEDDDTEGEFSQDSSSSPPRMRATQDAITLPHARVTLDLAMFTLELTIESCVFEGRAAVSSGTRKDVYIKADYVSSNNREPVTWKTRRHYGSLKGKPNTVPMGETVRFDVIGDNCVLKSVKTATMRHSSVVNRDLVALHVSDEEMKTAVLNSPDGEDSVLPLQISPLLMAQKSQLTGDNHKKFGMVHFRVKQKGLFGINTDLAYAEIRVLMAIENKVLDISGNEIRMELPLFCTEATDITEEDSVIFGGHRMSFGSSPTTTTTTTTMMSSSPSIESGGTTPSSRGKRQSAVAKKRSSKSGGTMVTREKIGHLIIQCRLIGDPVLSEMVLKSRNVSFTLKMTVMGVLYDKFTSKWRDVGGFAKKKASISFSDI